MTLSLPETTPETTPETEAGAELDHVICPVCYPPLQYLGRWVTALCGTRTRDDDPNWAWFPKPGMCVVCADMFFLPCPQCGTGA